MGAAVAGEVSGHFFFGELGYDDGLYAALMMARASFGLSEKPLSALADEIRLSAHHARSCRHALPLRRAAELARPGGGAGRDASVQSFPLDGVRLDFDDGWVLMRKSVTAEQDLPC